MVATILRHRRFWLFATFPALAIIACWWLTEPLEERGVAASVPPTPRPSAVPPPPPVALAWPEGTLTGDEAKRRLLEILLACKARLDRVEGYTATFRKQ